MQALAISPICPEAYNLLALAKANTYEEALEYYKKAEELGSKVGCDCWGLEGGCEF
jgi:lipoprotein NlpI